MKVKYIIGALLVIAALAILLYFNFSSRVPAGQPALQSLNARNVDSVKDEFNAAKDDVRVLLLLSPT